jgi:hypothetical protein
LRREGSYIKVHKVQEGYYARVGDFFGPVKPNANQALEALNSELESYHPLNHTYVRATDGTFFHVFQMPSHKWNYNVIRPDGKVETGGGVQGTWREAVDQAKQDAVDNFGGVFDA